MPSKYFKPVLIFLMSAYTCVNAQVLTIGTGVKCTTSGSLKLALKNGGLKVNGEYNPGTGTVIFTGDSLQKIEGTGAISFFNLSIDKTNTRFTNYDSTGVTLKAPVTVSGNLSLSSSVIHTSSTNMLTSLASGTVAVSDSFAYIDGPFTRETNIAATAYYFPVGANGGIRAAYMTPQANTASSYTVYYHPLSPTGNILDSDLTAILSKEYWDFTNNSGSDAIPSFYYRNPNTEVAGAATSDWSRGFNPCEDCNVAVVQKNSGSWYFTGISGAGFTPLQTTYWQSNNITAGRALLSGGSKQYSFGFGYSVILPVSLVSFTARSEAGNALVNWQFAPGSNPLKTELQRSANGKDFKTIFTVAGSVNDRYSFTDFNLLPGVYYYKLLIKDRSAKVSTSKTILLATGRNTTLIGTLTPTLVHNETFAAIHSVKPQNLKAILYDISGRMISQYQGALVEGNNKFRFSTVSIVPGLYNIFIATDDGAKAILRFIKE